MKLPIFVLIFIASVAIIPAAALSPDPPNILFILCDDLGWKDVGYNGSQYYETPNIDQLAKRGMVFTNAYANAPVCGPSRAALMSGQYRSRRYSDHESVSPWVSTPMVLIRAASILRFIATA